ncbi:MAG: hypothetical protein M3277_01675 [Actinomycetota bacterium]|nr:hypothetical protein [Actinomycetota bacterium]
MKRTALLLMVLGLIAGTIATAEAGKKKKAPPRIERVVEFEYSCPCGPRVLGHGVGWQFGSATGENIGGGPVTFDPTVENYLKAEVSDLAGQTVAYGIAMDVDPDDTSPNNTVADICGATTDPLEMPDVEAEFRVFVNFGTCADGTPSIPTQGTITFTLSNIP